MTGIPNCCACTKMAARVFAGTLALAQLTACGWFGSSNPFTAESFDQVTRSIEQFEYQPQQIDTGAVYHFQISNRDRSYAKTIFLFVAANDRIESFKIYPGSNHTVLVIAEIDWNLFSIRQIHQLEIQHDLTRKRTIEMRLADNPDEGYLFMEQPVPTGHFPAFNHGFDFSDLNFVFRHLADPRSDVEVGIISPAGQAIAYTGKMHIRYAGEAPCNGGDCYRYSLGGRGVSNRAGHLLVNRDNGNFEYMELDANYHPQFDYFRYELATVTHMSQTEWASFVTERSREYFTEQH